MRSVVFAVGALMMAASQLAAAQTCANPIVVKLSKMPYVNAYLPYQGSGNSCQSISSISSYDNFDAPGRDVVYKIVVDSTSRLAGLPAVRYSVIPNSTWDPTLFACSQCNVTPTCITGGDDQGPGFSEVMDVPAQSKSYYVMVDSKQMEGNTSCGQYGFSATPMQ